MVEGAGFARAGFFAMVCALVVGQVHAGTTFDVIDDRGRHVILDAPARRIVSLAPSTTELVFASGAGAALVAVTEFSDYPPAARALPSVGGLNGLDLERIVSLHPDLVIAWASGNSRTELDQLEHAGIAVFESDPSSVSAIADTLSRLGTLTGHQAAASAAGAALLARFAALSRAEHEKAPVTVFYQVWDQPLTTLGGTHLMTSLINACGGSNLFAELTALAPTVDAEAVIARHPDVIVTDPDQVMHVELQWQKQTEGDPQWHAQVVGIEPDLLVRAGPRVVDGTAALCAALDAVRASAAGHRAAIRPN